jgi:hypothetical protein
MRKSKILPLLFLSVGLLSIASCGKSSNSVPVTKAVVANTISVPKKMPLEAQANHNVKILNLRQAKDFAVFANTSIFSIPSSTISGKVGLRPGTRSLITLEPTEVVGGLPEVYAGDDKVEANASFLTQAKVDIINAYNEAETRVTDADKVGLWNGNLGNKVLVAGVYEFKSRVTIPLDLKLEGNETDVWIFKVAGQLRVGTDVHVTLSGGAKASNVFWQVGDDVLIKARSAMVGTIISQQAFEMKEQASLVGRAFSKNDKLVLNKNTITMP